MAIKEIAYSSLTPTTEVGAICPCGEYKGMVDCPECTEVLCLYCDDACFPCGLPINWSA